MALETDGVEACRRGLRRSGWTCMVAGLLIEGGCSEGIGLRIVLGSEVAVAFTLGATASLKMLESWMRARLVDGVRGLNGVAGDGF